MIRTFDHSDVESLATHASIPVINGLTDRLHPCQVLADLLTIKEKRGRLAGLKLAYTGDGNNVAHSLLLGCSKMGLHVAVAGPGTHWPLPEVVAQAQENAAGSGGSVLVTEDPREAVRGADVLYTDVWASMGQEAEKAARKKIFAPYQLNENLVKAAGAGVLVMHCLPAYRGEEITAAVLEGEQSVVLDQAENRLHAQKSLMALLMG